MTATRRIVAWASVTLDGYTSGPEGPAGDTWLYEHVGRPQTAEYFEGIWRGADTILLGRKNYEGFHAVWVLVGGGLRLFPDGVAARFDTAGVTALEHGAVGLHLRRAG